jgi:mono/diheme cytochrome c family protein
VSRHGERLRSRTAAFAASAAVVLALAACGGDEATTEGVDLARGERLFENNCVVCHGPQGTGTVNGPPLVHEIYEPGHHSDEAFRRAIAQGSPQHHWDYGDMPAVPGLNDDEVEDIIGYVRELQREAGIIDRTAGS